MESPMAIKKYVTKSGEIRYQAECWKNNQRVDSKTFSRKADANEYLLRLQQKMTDQKVGRLKGLKISYNTFFLEVYLVRATVREGTIRDYLGIHKRYVEKTIGTKYLGKLDTDEWSEFISGLQKLDISKGTINRIHAAISAVYSMAVEQRYAAANPMKMIGWYREPLTKLDFWASGEVQKFLEHCIRKDLSLAVLYQTAFETGMRIGELLGLKRDCIDVHNNAITICRTYNIRTRKMAPTTKNGHERVIGLNPGLKNALIQLMSKHGSDFVFCNKNGTHLKYEYVNKMLKRDQRKAEVRRLGLHGLRHTYASHYVMNGGSIYELKELLGHAEVETTMRYAHLAKSHLKAKSMMVKFEMPLENNVIAIDSVAIETSPTYFPRIQSGQFAKK
jgi:site-specific recombinase XerD